MSWQPISTGGDGGSQIISVPSKWTGKIWNVIGDSNTEWNVKANKKYHDYIKDKINCTVNNYGLSGSGYLDAFATPFYQRLNELDPNADLITVLGGGNNVVGIKNGTTALGTFGDTNPATSYYGALDYTFKALVEKYPSKTVACLSQFKRQDQTQVPTIELMVEALHKVCGKYGIPLLDLYNHGNVHAYNDDYLQLCMPDGVHLNDLGSQLIADKILSFINSL